MPSHSRTDTKKAAKLPTWAKEWHVSGNELADKAADQAAARVELEMNLVKPVLHYSQLPSLIQARYAAILMHIEPRAKEPKVPVIPKARASPVPLAVLRAVTEHSVVEAGDYLVCPLCCGRVHLKDPRTRAQEFLLFPCTSVVCAKPCKPSLLYTPVQFGRKTTHETHTLAAFGKYIFCIKCGCYGVWRLKGLAKPCLHVVSVSSAYFLSRIDRADVDFAAPLPSVEGPLAIENGGSVQFSPEERQAMAVFRQESLAANFPSHSCELSPSRL